jgi:prepilin-type N-terminal cleavage/methylation domain-containing protein
MSRSRPNRRPAFTLVELLVVIAIIGVLVALLLPAIQAARESARRTSCNNNLKNLGIAVLNFNDTQRKLPTSNRAAGATNAPRYAWCTLMLPYFEEQNTFDQYDFKNNWSKPTVENGKPRPNFQVVGQRLPVFECPSVPDDDRLDGDPQWWTVGLPDWVGSRCAAPTDYAPISQVENRLAKQPPEGLGLADDTADKTGMLLRNTVASLRQVTDGTSHTILLAESAGRPRVYRKGVRIGDLPDHRVNGGGWCRPASEYGLDGFDEAKNASPGPCAVNCTNGEDIYDITGGSPNNMGSFPYQFYVSNGTSETFAFHPSGANHLFGDGSVHLLNEDIEIRTYARLVTRKGGETISADDID